MKIFMRKFIIGLALTHGVVGIDLRPGGPYITLGGSQPGHLNVHLVAHTHDDVGWLKTVEQLYLGSRNDIQISSVQYILDSMLESLSHNPDRKFIYVELAFFSKWWRHLDEFRRARVVSLLKSGQLEFINGGWVSHDEASPTFLDIIDQHTLGATFINTEFGEIAHKIQPRVGWQVDPFGHSFFQAQAYSAMGMDAWYFGRSDSQDFAVRKATRTLESIHSSILAGSMDGYGPPPGFDWDIMSGHDPLNDDADIGRPNIEEKLNKFASYCRNQSNYYNDPSESTQHILLTMGSDFQYGSAHTWFKNMDMLIHYMRQFRGGESELPLNVFYSTPTIYTRERFKQGSKLAVRSDYDWFPYGDGEAEADESGNILRVTQTHAFWTGYFASRPFLKKLVREASSVLSLCRVAEIFDPSPRNSTGSFPNLQLPVLRLWESLSVAQHHDAVSGTSRQAVANDYSEKLIEGMDACVEYAKKVLGSQWTGVFQSIPSRMIAQKKSSLSVQFGYYTSSTGNTTERPGQASGAYIFRPDVPEGDVTPCRPRLISEGIPNSIDVQYPSLASDPITIEWSIGPLPDDGIGREVVLLIENSGIDNAGKFFTDSNGFAWMTREINKRPTWNMTVTDPVSANFYPVSNGLVIADNRSAMMVIPDRAVGGTSLVPGTAELMVHRRIFHDDDRGVVEPLNEKSEDGRGIIVRGRTQVWIVKNEDGQNPFQVPVWALRPPVVLDEALERSFTPTDVLGCADLPEDVVLTHVHRHDVDCGDSTICLVIRVMNTHTTDERTVRLTGGSLSRVGIITSVTETTLNAARLRADAEREKIEWVVTQSVDERRYHLNSVPPVDILLRSGVIRTFILGMKKGESLIEEPVSIETV
jgi:hypothetical protein